MYKIIYTKRAIHELTWFTSYYLRVFPEGQVGAYINLQKCLDMILEFPEIGRPDMEKNIREFGISKTRFSIIYKIEAENINILSIWDDRRNPTYKSTG